MTTLTGLPTYVSTWLGQLGYGASYISAIASHFGVGEPFYTSTLAGRTDYTPMTVTVTPSFSTTAGIPDSSHTVTVTVTGGTGDYTAYAWNYAKSGSSGAVTISGSTTGTSLVLIVSTVGGIGSTVEALYNCTVTDSSGASVSSTTNSWSYEYI